MVCDITKLLAWLSGIKKSFILLEAVNILAELRGL
jgi:hypothetical protein